MAHAQKPDFVFRRSGLVHLNWHGRQFSRLLAAEVCASAVVMLDTPNSEVVWRVLATHSIRQFPLYFPSRASPCAITFQLDSTCSYQTSFINPLNPELNSICCLLALLAHHFLHVSRIRVKYLTLRLLMSYIYIYMEHLFLMFLDHTQRRSTVGRTPLDEWSARRRHL